MPILDRIKSLVQDPPPEFVFELSPAGIAWADTAAGAVQWTPFDAGVLEATPLEDNIKTPEAVVAALRRITGAGPQKKPRRVAVILPDYAARVGVMEVENLLPKAEEQETFLRFQMKRTLSFDAESAVLRWYAQPKDAAGKLHVVVAAIAMEVAARYEGVFRDAGCHAGFMTVSSLAALALPPADGAALSPTVMVKLSGRVLAVSVLAEGRLRMVRCLELPEVSEREIFDVLVPTCAVMEDELGSGPRRFDLCGFPVMDDERLAVWEREFGAPVERVRSRFGAPGPYNAGLHGWLEAGGNL